MIFFRKKIKPISIQHPLGKDKRLTKGIEESRLKELTLKLKNGESDCIEEIVFGYIKIALNIVGQYARLKPRISDELVSEALYGIIIACKKVQAGKLKDENIGGFIIAWIHSKLGNRFKREMKRDKITKAEKRIKKVRRSKDSVAELKEVIRKCIKTDLEKEIIDLRELSLTDKEISERLNISNSQVHLIRAKVRDRFELEMYNLEK